MTDGAARPPLAHRARLRTVLAMRYLWLGLLVTLGLAAVAVPSSQASAATGCSASYATASEWSGGFVGGVTVTNTGSTALTGWTVTFTFGGDQKVTSYWNAALTQSINYVTASSLSYNGAVAAGGSASFGFQGTWSGSAAVPASVTCTPSSAVTPAIVASPTSQPVMQGFTSSFGVALSAAPSATVTVSVSRTAGNTGLSASGTSLTFTPADWNTAQNVTIDADPASTGAATFTVGATGYTPASVTLTESASTAAPQLHVSGNELVDASGHQVVLHGMDRSGAEYACVQG